MLHRILVPLDGSALAARALTFATALSIPTAARLVLVRAVTAHTLPGVDEREAQVHVLAETESYLREVADGLIQRGFAVEVARPYGDHPAAWIIEESRMRKADLIVMSTHGRTGPGRWVFGSVAEAVVAGSPVPVLLQRAWDPIQRELVLGPRPRLVVPLDGSSFAEAALPVAAGLAEDLGAELLLVTAETTPPDVKAAEEDVAAYLDGQERAADLAVPEYLDDVSRRVAARWADLSVSTRTQAGEPATAIATAAEHAQAALVVMATHGRTGLRRATLGSVAGRVLEHGNTPLVLVPPTAVD
ncbi:MAG TPA: universal stress protein [Chloroflexota bacterium]